MKKLMIVKFAILLISINSMAQNIGINATGATPDVKAMLDVSSTTSGVLIPRMTTAERNAISSPPNGLQVFNNSSNTLDVYRSSAWYRLGFTDSQLVMVQSVNDLPAAASGVITLDPTMTYSIRGGINISPNAINLNGAAVIGTNPSLDAILSSTTGAILRSTNNSVFLQNLAVIPLSGTTKAYDFSDATSSKYCNIFSGCSVVEIGIPSLGVGQISGFRAITLASNFWLCSDGIKVTGNVGKFCSFLNFMTGITGSNAAIEFLSAINIEDIDLSNNYFSYTGATQKGIKVNSGATIDYARMTTNMFRGVPTFLDGFDSYSPSWSMSQNTGIPDSRAFSTIYMNNNATSTSLTNAETYYKIAGTTTALSTKRFTTSNNRITYTGKNSTTVRVYATVGGRSPANNTDFTIAFAKNGTIIEFPNSSMGAMINNQGYQIALESEVTLSNGDYIEVFMKRSSSSGNAAVVSDMQFRLSDF